MLSKWFGVMGGVGTTTSFLPQVFKSLRSSSLDGISPLMLVIHFCGVSSWMVYGYLQNDPILVATNSIAAILVGTIGVRYLFVYYHHRGRSSFLQGHDSVVEGIQV